MGLRALIGVQSDDGRYRARRVHDDGCPDVIVPALTHLITHNCAGMSDIACRVLLACDWTRIHLHVATQDLPAKMSMVPSPNTDGIPETGSISDGNVGDREWAYLFTGSALSVYLGVRQVYGTQRWEPWANWPLTALADLPRSDILAVQKSGYRRQSEAAHEAGYVAALAERYGWNLSELARTFDELNEAECNLLGLDIGSGTHLRSELTRDQRERLTATTSRGGR